MMHFAQTYQDRLLNKSAMYASKLLIEKALESGWIKDEGLKARASDPEKREKYLEPIMLEIGRYLDGEDAG